MKRTLIFLVFVYLVSAAGAWVLLSKKAAASATTTNELAATKSILETEQVKNGELEAKIAAARANTEFLSLALCPTIETSKDALCVKNSTEWFAQTIQTGTTLSDADTKTQIEALLVSLGKKKQPTAKEFYDLLKPIELSSLKSLAETLK